MTSSNFTLANALNSEYNIRIYHLLFFSCYSNVGRRGGRQIVSIGLGCLRLGTPIHEIMHVLGFFHEMARPDRDETVKIHWENIKPSRRFNQLFYFLSPNCIYFNVIQKK